MSRYDIVWDGTSRYGRYLSVEADDPRPAPARSRVRTNRLDELRAWFARGRRGTMTEILRDFPRGRDSYRRGVYLLCTRGDLTYTTRTSRRGLVERVYRAAEGS